MTLKLFISIALLTVPFAAHANTFVTFDATGTFQSGSLLTGTVTFDPVSGTFLSSNLSTTGTNAYAFSTIQGQTCDFPANGDCELSLAVPGGGFPNLNFAFSLNGSTPGASLVGYNGGSLASINNPAADGVGFVSDIYFSSVDTDDLVSGSFTPSPVPEPSTLSLLGTGTLGLLGLARRRFRRA